MIPTYRIKSAGDGFQLVTGADDRVVAEMKCHPWDATDIARLVNAGVDAEHGDYEARLSEIAELAGAPRRLR